MNQMIYKEIIVNKVLFKTLTTTNFNLKNIVFVKTVKNIILLPLSFLAIVFIETID